MKSVFNHLIPASLLTALVLGSADAEPMAKGAARKPLKAEASPPSTEKTPLSIYQKQVSELVGRGWYSYVRQFRDVYRDGETRIVFHLDREGHMKDLRVVSNTSNESFAQMCELCVRQARFPAPPRGLLDAMPNEVLEIPFTFTLY